MTGRWMFGFANIVNNYHPHQNHDHHPDPDKLYHAMTAFLTPTSTCAVHLQPHWSHAIMANIILCMIIIVSSSWSLSPSPWQSRSYDDCIPLLPVQHRLQQTNNEFSLLNSFVTCYDCWCSSCCLHWCLLWMKYYRNHLDHVAPIAVAVDCLKLISKI